MKMAELQAGLGFGVKKFRLIWIFEKQDDLNKFINTGVELTVRPQRQPRQAVKEKPLQEPYPYLQVCGCIN